MQQGVLFSTSVNAIVLELAAGVWGDATEPYRTAAPIPAMVSAPSLLTRRIRVVVDIGVPLQAG
jgi:hypothetical protein